MSEIVGHVVAGKGQHSHRVRTELACLAFCGSRAFGTHHCAQIHAVCPVEGFVNERYALRPAAAYYYRGNRNAFKLVGVFVEAGAVRQRSRKAAVGVRCGRPAFGSPIVAVPVDEVRRRFFCHAFPPNVSVVGQCDVCEYRVLRAGDHRVGVGLHAGARSNSEEAVFGVDCIVSAVGSGLNPSDVVANACNLPALGLQFFRGYEHCKVSFAACARERARHVGLSALRVGDAENEHVLGHPAFVPAHYGSYAQAQALFAEEGVAAVSGADADDFARFREVGDVSVFGVARPENVVFGRVNRLAD